MAPLRYRGMSQSTQPAEGGLLATTVKIEGMTCGACVRRLAMVVEALPGVVHEQPRRASGPGTTACCCS
jgi:heavy-metal-associated domain-containing protein